MTEKFKLSELVDAKDSLAKLFKMDLLVSKISCSLGKSVKKINSEFQEFETQRNKLIQDINELLKKDIELDIEKVKLSELDGIKLSAVDMMHLEKFIDETD